MWMDGIKDDDLLIDDYAFVRTASELLATPQPADPGDEDENHGVWGVDSANIVRDGRTSTIPAAAKRWKRLTGLLLDYPDRPMTQVGGTVAIEERCR